MKQPDKVKIEFTRQWFEKAENDFNMSRHLIAGGESYAEGAAFHAQQAVEKYLKAFLVWHQVEFPKTHDIKRLLDLIAPFDLVLAEALREAATLTPYGVEYRYPGDYPEVSVEDAKRSLKTAGQVRDKIRKRLPQGIVN